MQMENEDCYFYYYSTCNKGEGCPYRHESAAMGTEDICEDWEYGDCRKTNCNLRHMRIKMSRATVRCYWESKPSGCRKAHCVFKHSNPRPNMELSAATSTAVALEHRTTTAVVNTGFNKNVPSPKVDPILISVGDADEESPQIRSRIKPAFSTIIPTKRISLKNPGIEANLISAAQSEGKKADGIIQSSKLLEDELLECAKKGIVEALDTALSCSTRSGTLPVVKVKTLQDIKREKILKARLEYERKKLLASEQEQGSSTTERNSNEPKSQAPVSILSRKMTAERLKQKNDRKAKICRTFKHQSEYSQTQAERTVSKIVEVSRLKSDNIKAIKVKSFSEIMEDKRKRIGEVQSDVVEAVDSNKAKPENNLYSQIPIIPVRKMKIRSIDTNTTHKRRGTRLKRSLPSEAEPGEAPLNVDKSLPIKIVRCESADLIRGDGVPPSSHGSIEAVETSRQPQSNTRVDDSSCQDITDQRKDTDVDSDLTLGDKSYSDTAIDIDDDDLMNEMEQLLA